MTIRNSVRYLEAWPTSKKVYMPNGRVPETGEIFRQPDLARTLRAMAAAEQKALAKPVPRATRHLKRCATISIAARSRIRSTNIPNKMAACCAMRTWRRST